MKKITAFFVVFLLFAAVALPSFAAATDIEFDLETTAKAIYLVNKDSGRVVFEKNATERIYPASCTKIMTAALALELCPDPANTMVTVPAGVWNEFAGINISSAGLMAGEEISMLDLVHCMLLQSANEAASTVAEYFGRDAFIAMMNDKAIALGCTDTHFVNPHGLFNEQHYSTARDMYLITEWAMSVPGFWDISCKSRYELAATNKHSSRWLVTTVKMQDKTSGYYTDYIRGIKTGTIDESGRCLVSAAVKNGVTYVAVVMGCPMSVSTKIWSQGNSVFTETRLMYDWCFSHLKLQNVVKPEIPIAEVPLRYASEKDYLMLYSTSDVSTVINKDSDVPPVITYETEIPQYIEAPVSAGQIIGSARVYSDGYLIGTVDLASMEDIELSYFMLVIAKLSKILTSPVAVLIYVLLFIFVLWYVYYMVIFLPNKMKAKKAAAAKKAASRRTR